MGRVTKEVCFFSKSLWNSIQKIKKHLFSTSHLRARCFHTVCLSLDGHKVLLSFRHRTHLWGLSCRWVSSPGHNCPRPFSSCDRPRAGSGRWQTGDPLLLLRSELGRKRDCNKSWTMPNHQWHHKICSKSSSPQSCLQCPCHCMCWHFQQQQMLLGKARIASSLTTEQPHVPH